MTSLLEFNNPFWKTDQQKFLQVVDLVNNHQRVIGKKLLSKCSKKKYEDYSELRKWIDESLPLLQDWKYSYATKCYWILNGLTDFPTCPHCHKKDGYKYKNVNAHNGYQKFCSQKCSMNSIDTQMSMKKSFRKILGVDHPSQLHEIHLKMSTKYKFNGLKFDSKPEIALYIWLKDHNVEFEFHPNKVFTFELYGKTHTYSPDFIIAGAYVEVKGFHFFKPDGTMFCPFRKRTDTDEQYKLKCEIVEAKHQCMIKNNVLVLVDADDPIKNCLKYVNSKYGKEFLNSLKNKMK